MEDGKIQACHGLHKGRELLWRQVPICDFALCLQSKKKLFLTVPYTIWNILKAKNILGISSSTKPEDLEADEVHAKFVSLLAQVLCIHNEVILVNYFTWQSALPKSKIDPRWFEEGSKNVNLSWDFQACSWGLSTGDKDADKGSESRIVIVQYDDDPKDCRNRIFLLFLCSKLDIYESMVPRHLKCPEHE